MDQLEEIDRLIGKGDLVEAERLTVEALKANPENAGLHFRRGQIYCRRQMWGSAINEFQCTLEIEPSYPEANEQIRMANAILGYFTPDMFNP